MRWLIIGAILALVVMVYALVDLTVTDDRRIRRLNRVLWVVLIVLVPVLGAIAWLVWGKGPRTAARPMAPDDDPAFGRSKDVTDAEADRRIAELEAQLAALDAEEIVRPQRPAPEQGAADDDAAEPEPDAAGEQPEAASDDEADGSDRTTPGDGPAARA